ncbi:MAG: lipid-A-disaccharide synthase [Legionella sp.]|nr:lipid-A-disaccharide synthase [Legionella sp.]
MPITACKHIVIVAGEESGDMHAAVLIKQLKENFSTIKISGIGGRHMQAAGAHVIADLAQYGVTGITEVFRHFKIIRQAFMAIKAHISQNPPDLLILVDYPGFNLRLANFAKKKLGLKIIYYISPQIWAWKANRIHRIKQCVDTMAVILPFEKSIYEQAQVPVRFVGHPLVERITVQKDSSISKTDLNLPAKATIIALLPGSRINEIERHMPILYETAKLLNQTHSGLHFVIPLVETLSTQGIQSYFSDPKIPLTIVAGKALDCMNAADFVIVASGTASLECALLGKPMCIIYKSSWITYYLAMKLLKVKFLGLSNLLANKMVVPEFLQYDFNAVELSRFFSNFHADPSQPQKMIGQLLAVKDSLSAKKSDCTLLELIESELPEINA